MNPKGLLMRVGIDQTFGQYNAPINPETYDYLYMPIPESHHSFRDGMKTCYTDIVPIFNNWASANNSEIQFPAHLLDKNCHLDPDFKCLTYGDQGSGRGNRIRQLNAGDYLIFFASFKPIYPCKHKLVYAIFGIMFVDKIIKVVDLPAQQWASNAHSRIIDANPDHLVVVGQPQKSGRFERAIPIGEHRNGAYRVTDEVLTKWHGLNVKNGFIQRSVCPPWFSDSAKFLSWLAAQQITLIHNNG